MNRLEVFKQFGISEQKYVRWRKTHGEMGLDQEAIKGVGTGKQPFKKSLCLSEFGQFDNNKEGGGEGKVLSRYVNQNVHHVSYHSLNFQNLSDAGPKGVLFEGLLLVFLAGALTRRFLNGIYPYSSVIFLRSFISGVLVELIGHFFSFIILIFW